MQVKNIPVTADDLALLESSLEDKLQALSKAKPTPLNGKIGAKAAALLAELRTYSAPELPAPAAPAAAKSKKPAAASVS